jgi:hypothetical protein
LHEFDEASRHGVERAFGIKIGVFIGKLLGVVEKARCDKKVIESSSETARPTVVSYHSRTQLMSSSRHQLLF